MTPPEHDNAIDARYMAMALTLARRGLGRTAPNPSVGAVVVAAGAYGETVLGRGWTGDGGRPHAETIALDRAGAAARGATLYVTLEPCNHHGKTPPCTEAIIAAGIARVVVAQGDPDPRVSGSGLVRLIEAGVAITTGVLGAEAAIVNAGHVLRSSVGEPRPYVQLKLAVSANGLVPRGHAGAPVWVTGPEARAHAHLMRAQADAILVGLGTVVADDPELTCRLPGLGDRSPIRIGLDRMAELPLTSRLVRSARQQPTWLLTSPSAPAERLAALRAAGVEVSTVASMAVSHPSVGAPWLDGHLVRDVVKLLAARGVTRLLVEGGIGVSRAFDAAGLVDEHLLYRGASEIAADAGEPIVGIWRREVLVRIAEACVTRLGDDTLVRLEAAQVPDGKSAHDPAAAGARAEGPAG